ncbi:MAG: branched-chain amino acid aminotransferase [Balneolaceae bacterium]|nr:MAG: branched-chain amino acid aminotransferase [Balneolaceae bacterium]
MKISRSTQSRISDINFDKLEFGRIFSDHMFQITYRDGAWQEPEILPYGAITFHPSMMALHYGQAIFEGMKAYYAGENRVNLFRPEDHLERLNNSARRLCMPEMELSVFIEALEELMKLDYPWVPRKIGQALYIRPVMFASEEYLAAKVSAEYKFFIITSPVAAYYSEGFNPVSLTTTDTFVRAVRGGTGEAKAAGNYGGSFLPAQEAGKKGFTQVLWLDALELKYVEEVGTMNIFFLIGDKLITPKLEGTVLPGITRRSVLSLARNWGLETEERKISIDEVFDSAESGTLREVFGAGTAAVISPVGRIHHRGKELALDTQNIGPFAMKMFEAITSLQYGKTEDTYGWIHPVDVG